MTRMTYLLVICIFLLFKVGKTLPLDPDAYDSFGEEVTNPQYLVEEDNNGARKLLYIPPQLPARSIRTEGRKIIVDEKPYFVKGVCYSPSPKGVDPISQPPYGDFFTDDFHLIWERDFPLIKSMGANTIRVYGWNLDSDHIRFLDTAYQYGLMVIITFFLGNTIQNPITTQRQRDTILENFVDQVWKYRGHPAILAWSFGNEINGDWNKYLTDFSNAYNCNWKPGTAPYGCEYDLADNGDCAGPVACVYQNLYSFIDQAAAKAKGAMQPYSHLITSCFADVDLAVHRWSQFQGWTNNIDMWGIHLYRGKNFGEGDYDFFRQYGESPVNKPIIIAEFGVDAYKDPCGLSQEKICYNTQKDPPPGFGEDQVTQAEWGSSLAQAIIDHSVYENRGPVAGGCIMAWVDEYWKAAVNVKGCYPQYPDKEFTLAHCDYKAHAQCPSHNLSDHAICGYPLDAPFDHYVNEGWWGIMTPEDEGGIVNKLHPRLIYTSLKKVWAPEPITSQWIWMTVIALGLGVLLVVAALALVAWRRFQGSRHPSDKSAINSGRHHRGRPRRGRYPGSSSNESERTPLV